MAPAAAYRVDVVALEFSAALAASDDLLPARRAGHIYINTRTGEKSITAYSDRELALEYENLGLKIGQWADAIKAAQAKRAEIEAEAKRRAAAKPAPVKGTSATKDGKP